MAERRGRTRTTADLLAGPRSRLGAEIAWMRALHEVWPRVAGPHMADLAWPIGIERDTLWLGVHDEARIQEIDFAAPGLLQRLRREFPQAPCRRIRCKRLEREAAPPASPSLPETRRPAPPVDDELLARIRNPALRERLAALAAAEKDADGE